MLDFQLFRVKVHPPRQGELFAKLDRPSLLREAVFESPTIESRRGTRWHIGNIERLDGDAMYFLVGRTTKTTLEVYQDGKFTEQQFEQAPYTHCFLDTRIGLCAVARKTRLSLYSIAVARQLGRLLEAASSMREDSLTVKVEEINDPTKLVEYIREAASVTRYWISFDRPNPIDVNDEFWKPFERFVEATGGERGKAELAGGDLNRRTLEDLTRTAATTANDAAAWVRETATAKPVRKKLRGNPVTQRVDSVSSSREKKGFLKQLRQLYSDIKGKISAELG